MKDIEIPAEVAWLDPKSWPHQSSETGMRQIADHCYSQAQALTDLNSNLLQQTRQRVQQALTGAAAEAADQQLLNGANRVDTLVGDLRAHGTSAEVSATHIEDAKRKGVTTLAIAANSIIAAVSDWQRTGNPAPLMQIPVIKALAEYSIGKAVSDAGGRIEDTLASKLASTTMAGPPDAGAIAAAIMGRQFAEGHRIDIGDALHSALSMGVAGPGALTALQTSLHHAPANVQPTGIQLATQHSTGAGAPVNGRVPLHQLESPSGDIREVVDVSVNGGKPEPVALDTGSNGLVFPLEDIPNLGLPTGLSPTIYGTTNHAAMELMATFKEPVEIGNMKTVPTDVHVPLLTVEVKSGIPSAHLGGIFNSSDGYVGILGVGPNALAPDPGILAPKAHPFLDAFPHPFNEGVDINVPDHYIQFGPNPRPGDTLQGSPYTTVDVQVGNGPIHRMSNALFDTGGEYGAIPAPYLGKNDTETIMNGNVPVQTVRDGTPITIYDPNSHKELSSYTVTHNHKPEIVPKGLSFNFGLPPFLEHEIYIGNEDPNSGSPGSFGDFAQNVGTTTIDR